jgi:hypothetical protein
MWDDVKYSTDADLNIAISNPDLHSLAPEFEGPLAYIKSCDQPAKQSPQIVVL